ncbi:hypothetical protein SDC9_131814 [bioreactor metagenome]|uniref:Uncharacterized protein n=1 Tax=bioreactor metagenome TaxID=1076179 RepID=A0A645D6Q0_9ZZZZ
MITPTQERPTLIFNADISVGTVDGIIRCFNVWNLEAPKVFNSLILSSSTSLKPARTLIIVTIIDIKRAITIIASMPFPTQNIIIGPRATLGRAFKTTK